MKKSFIESETRKIFHDIHIAQGDNKEIFNRLTSLLNTDYLQVEKKFFENKICLDAGCGSNGNATFAMLEMGAKKVHAFDLDDSILKTVPRHLNGFEGKYVLSIGNVLKLDFLDDFFDFVHCSGVLHHTEDAFLGLKELARVTKPQGMLYIMINGKGGILKDITNCLREKYQNDNNFKYFIDNLDETQFVQLWKWIKEMMLDHGDEIVNYISIDLIKKLFNKDLVLTIKDRIMAPLYDEYTESELVECLSDRGFIKIKRLKRYPAISNLRRFLSPFYLEHDNDFSKLLYGEGLIQLIAQKV